MAEGGRSKRRRRSGGARDPYASSSDESGGDGNDDKGGKRRHRSGGRSSSRRRGSGRGSGKAERAAETEGGSDSDSGSDSSIYSYASPSGSAAGSSPKRERRRRSRSRSRSTSRSRSPLASPPLSSSSRRGHKRARSPRSRTPPPSSSSASSSAAAASSNSKRAKQTAFLSEVLSEDDSEVEAVPSSSLPSSSPSRRAAESEGRISPGEAEWLAGVCFSRGECGADKSERKAEEMFRRAAKKRFYPAYAALAECLQAKGRPQHDREEALRLLESAARRSDAAAMHGLALCLYKGACGAAKDTHRALRLLRAAAAAQHPPAERCLADVLVSEAAELPESDAGRLDKERDAALMYKRAHRHGDLLATVELAKCYHRGVGVQGKSLERMADLLRDAADRGHCGAALLLARCYEKGKGVERSADRAVRYFRKAAALGSAEALNLVGTFLLAGDRVRRDTSAAFGCFEQAAAMGHAGAQRNLGRCYELGEGVRQSYVSAVKKYRLAIKGGDADAPVLYARVLKEGKGAVRQDLARARTILRSAAYQNKEAAKLLAAVETQIAESGSSAAPVVVKREPGKAPAAASSAGAAASAAAVAAAPPAAASAPAAAAAAAPAPAPQQLPELMPENQPQDEDWLMRSVHNVLVGLTVVPDPNGTPVPAAGTPHIDPAVARIREKEAYDESSAANLNNWGVANDLGRGVPTSATEAARAFARAVQLRSVIAMYNTAVMLYRGRDRTEGALSAMASHLARAVKQNLPQAQFALGLCVLRGAGTERKPVDASVLLSAAAKAGVAGASTMLGRMHAAGVGVKRSKKLAGEHYARAAAAGDAAGMYLRAMQLVSPSSTRTQLLQRAADKGHAAAAFEMGRFFLERGTDLSAADMFRRASDAGHAEATAQLGSLHERGIGVTKDAAKALELYERASAAGSTMGAERRARLLSRI